MDPAAFAVFVARCLKGRTDVPALRPEEVRQGLAAGAVRLVDVRSAAEQAVSRIAGAVGADAPLVEGALVVCYCTVGVRSHDAALLLRRQGIPASNLWGGVLAWARAGFDFVDATGPTRRVHVFGPKWSLLPEGYEPVVD